MARAVTARAGALGLAHKLTVITGNAMKVDFPRFDVCASNIPYGISSPLIAKLLFGRYRFRAATLLLQWEFARRLAAAPGDREFNRLAENVRLVADVRLLMDVSRADFVPVPRVDSAVVGIRPREVRPREVAPGVATDEWLAFVCMCFERHNQRNKKKGETTLGTIFKRDELVMELLRRRRSSRADDEELENGSVVVDDGRDEEDEQGSGDDDDDEGLIGFTKEEVVAFKERINGAVQSAGLANKKPSIVSNKDLLRLLGLFNERGVRFSRGHPLLWVR